MCYHPGFRVIPVIGVFIRERKGGYAQREAKDRSPLKRCCQKPGGTGRCKEAFSPGAFRGSTALSAP